MKWLIESFLIALLVVGMPAAAFFVVQSNSDAINYSGGAFELRTIEGVCFARKAGTSTWFDCVAFFRNKQLIRK